MVTDIERERENQRERKGGRVTDRIFNVDEFEFYKVDKAEKTQK